MLNSTRSQPESSTLLFDAFGLPLHGCRLKGDGVGDLDDLDDEDIDEDDDLDEDPDEKNDERAGDEGIDDGYSARAKKS
jgi:hypothetical protein